MSRCPGEFGLTQYAKRWDAVFLAAIPVSVLILLGLGV